MNTLLDPESLITAAKISEEQRIHALPKHFGRHMLRVEQTVYSFMRTLARQYTGGYWHYF